MKILTLKPQLHFHHSKFFIPSANCSQFFTPIKPTSRTRLQRTQDVSLKTSSHSKPSSNPLYKLRESQHESSPTATTTITTVFSSKDCSRMVIFGAVSIGVVLFLMGFDDQKALALGPEGPLMEEFWDNMRRYGLYALTVSTGVLYAVFQPIVELLKNPISAILVLTILGGGIFIVSQVVSAMVGLSDFSYEYSS